MTALYPCTPWPIDPSCCPAWPEDPAEWTDAHREAQWLATIELWRAVGGIIGVCRTVERPCLDECAGSGSTWSSAWMTPYIRDGNWFNSVCGCQGDCSCSPLCMVTLQGPVHQIISVSIGGQIVSPSTYRLITGDRLARTQGCWPACQDLRVPDADGFTVTYIRGTPPGPDAIRAVSMLACRKLRECDPGGSGDCGALPAGTTSFNRDGISVQLSDEGGFRSDIRFVNDWVASINPYGLTEPPSVWSPDVPEPLIFYEGPVQ
jgi:hypothetical protein